MKSRITRLGLPAALLSASLFAACQNTARGVEQDTERNTAEAKQEAREAGAEARQEARDANEKIREETRGPGDAGDHKHARAGGHNHGLAGLDHSRGLQRACHAKDGRDAERPLQAAAAPERGRSQLPKPAIWLVAHGRMLFSRRQWCCSMSYALGRKIVLLMLWVISA